MANAGYHRYMHSEAWLSITRQVKQRSRGVCERCKINKAAHVHHEHYVNFGHESLDDLLHLCLSCHNEKHPRHNFHVQLKRKKKKRKLKNLSKLDKALLSFGYSHYVFSKHRSRRVG